MRGFVFQSEVGFDLNDAANQLLVTNPMND
jgi:hypothetical protein